MAIKVVLLVLFLITNLSSPVISQNDDDLSKGASFIFGDSLVDAGNNNYLPTLSRANIRPNGIDFKASGGAPTGRYTNGRTIGDIVGKIHVMLPLFLPLCIKFLIYNDALTHCARGGTWPDTLCAAIPRPKHDWQGYLVRR